MKNEGGNINKERHIMQCVEIVMRKIVTGI